MNETTTQVPETQEEATSLLPAAVLAACEIAAGRAPADPDATALRIVGAKKDLNCKGRGPHWYRMVFRNGAWMYVSTERLPSGTFRASDRRASVYGEVFPGEIVADHDRGGPLNAVGIAHERIVRGDRDKVVLTWMDPPKKRRDGLLKVVLPDGSELVVPNPRSK